jgi:uncharacterized protein (DUF427 family)
MTGETVTESVWDYPRPPRVEPVSSHIEVTHAGVTLVSTNASVRVLETSHPPTYCEFKGVASYFDIVVGDQRIERAAWTYDNPSPGFESLAGKVALYANQVDECRVGDEVVIPQEGDFYGGWITRNIEGPFKGAPGTRGW